MEEINDGEPVSALSSGGYYSGAKERRFEPPEMKKKSRLDVLKGLIRVRGANKPSTESYKLRKGAK